MKLENREKPNGFGLEIKEKIDKLNVSICELRA
jgi:hypothetical protein